MTPVRQPAVNRLSAPTAEAAVNLAIIIQQAATHSYSTWDRQDGAIRLPAGRIQRDKKAGFNPGNFFLLLLDVQKENKTESMTSIIALLLKIVTL